MVHGIVRTLQGGITVYSEPGQGTSLHVYLPLTDRPAMAAAAAPQTGDLRGRGERILFVDDEAQICGYMGALLEGQGYQVTVFSDSLQAWETFRQEPGRFDLVVTDMTMPHLPGHELARRILAVRPALPVILCTGPSALINRARALEMGIADYLDKPVPNQTLLAALRKALSRQASGPLAGLFDPLERETHEG